jgi:tRNA(Ile)-lysidine synthase
LIRPLLETTRVQTEAHCRAAGLRPRRDPSNQDPAFFRNRLRLRLLPVLASYNPGIRDVLTRTGEVMRREAAMLDELLDEAEPGVMTHNQGESIRLNRTAWLELPAPVQAGLLWRAVIALFPAQRDLGFQAIELARARIKDRSMGRRTPLPGGVEMVEQGDFVLFHLEGSEPEYPGYPQLPVLDELQLPLPGRILLQGGGVLVADRLNTPPTSWSPSESLGLDPEAWLDAAKLSAFLLVRPAKPGDRMRPLGMQGHRKLGDIFNSLHIPSAARRRWPVVVSGEAIVWLAGLRISDDARVTASTRQAIRLRVELPEGIALRHESHRASHRASHPAGDPAGEPDGGIPEGT